MTISRIAAIALLFLLLAPSIIGIVGASQQRLFPEDLKGDNIIRIAVSLNFSGDTDDEPASVLCGLKAGVDWVNGKGGVKMQGKQWMLQLVYDDNAGDPARVEEFYRQAARGGIKIFMAPYSEDLTLNAAQVAVEEIAFLAVYMPYGERAVKVAPYAIQVASPLEERVKSILAVITDYKKTDASIIVVREDSNYGKEATKIIRNLATQLGHNIIAEIIYEPGTLTQQLDSIPGRDTVDVLVFFLSHLRDLEVAVSEAYNSKLGFNLVILDEPGSIPTIYVKLGSAVAENLITLSDWEPTGYYTFDQAKNILVRWYGPELDEIKTLWAKHCPAIDPNSVMASATAALLVVADLLSQAGSDDPKMLFDKAKTYNAMNFYGNFAINPDGTQRAHIPLVVQWQDGAKRIIFPKHLANAEPIFPADNWLNKIAKAEPTTTQTTQGQQAPGAQDTGQQEQAAAQETTQEGGFPVVALIAVVIVIAVAGLVLMKRK